MSGSTQDDSFPRDGSAGDRYAGLVSANANDVNPANHRKVNNMAGQISADASIEAMASALQDAAGDLEQLSNGNRNLQEQFEQNGWRGFDALAGAEQKLAGVRDALAVVAEKIGVGGGIVRDAHLNNNMIRDANKASLGHA